MFSGIVGAVASMAAAYSKRQSELQARKESFAAIVERARAARLHADAVQIHEATGVSMEEAEVAAAAAAVLSDAAPLSADEKLRHLQLLRMGAIDAEQWKRLIGL